MKLKTVSKCVEAEIIFDFYTPINIEFEEMYPGRECVHCYEISDTKDKSLLEIAIGSTSGDLKYITLVIPPPICIGKELYINHIINEIEGLPSFETKNWSRDNLHTNVKIDFDIYVNASKILFALLPNKITMKIINNRVVFGFDASNILCSIEIMDITASERELFEESLTAKGKS